MFSQAKKCYRALWKMNKSLIPQGENITSDETIMGKENQLIFQDIREWEYKFFNDTKKVPKGKINFKALQSKTDIPMYRYD